jgi:hypothetical protein
VVNDDNRQNHHDHCCLLVILIEFDLYKAVSVKRKQLVLYGFVSMVLPLFHRSTLAPEANPDLIQYAFHCGRIYLSFGHLLPSPVYELWEDDLESEYF